jgi:hypothetical protein
MFFATTAVGLGCVKTFRRGRTPASTNSRIPGQVRHTTSGASPQHRPGNLTTSRARASHEAQSGQGLRQTSESQQKHDREVDGRRLYGLSTQHWRRRPGFVPSLAFTISAARAGKCGSARNNPAQLAAGPTPCQGGEQRDMTLLRTALSAFLRRGRRGRPSFSGRQDMAARGPHRSLGWVQHASGASHPTRVRPVADRIYLDRAGAAACRAVRLAPGGGATARSRLAISAQPISDHRFSSRGG